MEDFIAQEEHLLALLAHPSFSIKKKKITNAKAQLNWANLW